MHQKFSYLQSIKIIVLALLIAVGTGYLSADWTAPISTPPKCIAGDPGCDAPINVGYGGQIKKGSLEITGLLDATTSAVNGLIVANGFVGIGTRTPSQKLDVSGKIALNGTVIAYQPTAMPGTLILGNGGNNLLHTSVNDGYYNTFVGLSSGNANTTGYNNTANGFQSLFSNTTGYYNTVNGAIALYSNTTGSNNTANGLGALYNNTTGSNNTANGFQSLYSNTTGSYNIANGYIALISNTTGDNNTANGSGALQSNTRGYNNTANGYAALVSNLTGNSNTAIGYAAGKFIADGKTGNQTSNSSIYLGYDTRAKTDGGANEIVIGASAIGNGSYSVTLGSTTITKTILQGNIGIGTTTPSQKLEVNGNINIEGATNGIIMHDTVTTACYLVQIRNGAFAMTSHACKYPSPAPSPSPSPSPSP